VTYAEDAAGLVHELLDEVTIRPQWTEYRTGARGRRAEQRAVTRHDPGLLWQLGSVAGRVGEVWARVDIVEDHPLHGEVRVGQRLVRTATIGAALVGATVPSGSPGWDSDGALSPMRGGGWESAEPTTQALLLEDQIASEVADVHGDLTHVAGVDSTRLTVGGRLRETVALVALVDEDVAAWAVARLRSWVSACRVLLTYEARTIELARWHCPECGGRVRTRVDGDTQVWCAGVGAVHGPPVSDEAPFPVVYGPCGATWSKGQWVDFMTRQQPTGRTQ
jgi:hypothetical protein